MDHNEIWEAVLVRLSEKISRMEFFTWFQKVRLLEISGGAVLLACPTEMNKNWLENKYFTLLLSNFKAVFPEITSLYFKVDLSLADKPSPHPQIFAQKEKKSPRKLPNRPDVKGSDGLESRITQEKFSLKNFITGPENQFAHAACMAVAETPINEPKKYNPLFIYSGVGLGKTHLLQGTANEIMRRNPNARVIYNTSERFMNEIIKSIREKRTEELRKRYRSVDVLILDDVQFFEGKERTQEELFNTFNDLFEFHKQIIFSSDRPPSELLGISDRLRSRMGWGLSADIQTPNYETRLAIIQEKSKEMELFLPPDVQEFIAANIRTNLRELENVLHQIEAEIEISKLSPTIQSVGKIFRKIHPNENLIASRDAKTGIVKSPDDIITAISDYFQIPATEILGTLRKKEIVFARQVCWLLCKDILRMSYEAIGKDFGGKNHTTIMHGIRKIKDLSRTDSATARHIHALKKDLGVK
jgi:chromosomal replication initiator protein